MPKGGYGDLSGAGKVVSQVYPATPSIQSAAAGSGDQRVRVADASDEVVPSADGGFQLNFEDADVAAVSKVVLGDILKANYLVDKRVTGQITLTSSQPIQRARLLPLFESALAGIGASVVKDRDIYRVVPSADPGGMGRVDGSATTEGFGTSVITAKYMGATNLGHLLEGMGSRSGSVRVDAPTNLVIVQGTAEERRAAIDAANAVDVDWLRSKSVAIFPVKNSAPDTIISELNRILDTGEGGLSQAAVQFQPISRLNAVLVVARQASGIEQVRRWVSRLDRVDPSAAGVKVYRLEYAQAKNVAASLNELFGGGGGGGGGTQDTDKNALEPSSQAPAQTSSPATTASTSQSTSAASSDSGTGAGNATPFGALKAAFNAADLSKARDSGAGDAGSRASSSKVHVTADVSSNSLLINSSASDYRLVEQAIHQMDRAPQQVHIEATIAEVTLTEDLQYGIQFYLRSKAGALGLSGVSGFPIPFQSTQGLSFLLGGAANPKVLIDFLQSMTTVKILSSPSLVVLDRQPAVLQVGDQVPILTRTAQSVDTTLAPVVNNVDYKDTGIILNVLPRINANGIVTLDIQQEISAVTSTDPTTLTPTISQRRVRSSVAVANGQTVMLGGLISDKVSSSRSGIPGLSSIRFLSDILNSHDNARDRTEIVIFVKPQIISNAADAEAVTEEFQSRLTSMHTDIRPAVVRKY